MARDDGGGAAAILVTFMLGAISGAAIALLLTPVPGSETRQYVNERAREGKKFAHAAARQGREYVNQQRSTLGEAFERGHEAYQHAREKEQA